jgi:hypothetical protein
MFTITDDGKVKDLILYYTIPATEPNFFYETMCVYKNLQDQGTKDFKIRYEKLPSPVPLYKFGPIQTVGSETKQYQAANTTLEKLIEHINRNLVT